ncbi:VOC family protein [Mucilaginibacter sp. 14171R-50]|uniref:VOC family protein n=1 Tax=Mucilaginibacter sp. 14171R-50 TaxID=2703789 RepID=UPI00138DBF50|nr:VOC family protein [Mucilaginibacter sp. 14171R-50]QHS54340.1 VOC family protein [Mucilaginibacter sp. 14171R-50]
MKTTHQVPNVKQAVPLFMVTNMEMSLRFYVEGLGFAITKTWVPKGKIEWCCLKRENVNIMLQEYHGDNPHRIATKGIGVTIWFQCNDALEIYTEFTAKGLVVKEPFVGNGMWDVGLDDPDGYSLHFESVTEVAEETKYFDWIGKKQ